MQIGIAQLKKLRGRSFKEIRERGKQEMAKLSERLRGGGAEMSDGELLRAICPPARSRSLEATVSAIIDRLRDGRSVERTFFPSLARREEIAEMMRRRFPAERDAIIRRAERACAGRFDLLGFKDLSFGDPIDWHLEPVSGKRTPREHWSKIDYLNPAVAGDKKITWELNRHSHFVTLGQAYLMTGDEAYARAFAAQLSSWMDANPPGIGINWASNLEVAFRMISWLWALHLFAPSEQITRALFKRVLKQVVSHGRHIESYLSNYFSPNTHLTGEALGLFYIGAALPELQRAEAWRSAGLKILLEQLSRQVRADGVYFEQATYYHRYTADFYTHLIALARAARIELPFEVEEKLGGLLDHLMWMTRPDGSSPLIGDDDGGRLIALGERAADDFRDTLATGAALFGRGDWKHVAGREAVETLWLLGADAITRYDEIKACAPRSCSQAFSESGYFVMRDGWSRDSSYAVIDCGPHGSIGGGHAHADALSLEFAAAGTTWIIDPGTFTYTSDAESRNLFRTTAAHNTVTVDDESQSVPAGTFSWSHTAKAVSHEFICGESMDYFEGAHDGYKRLSDPVTHARAVLFVKSSAQPPAPAYLVIRDTLTARQAHHYSMRYHLPALCSALASGNQVRATAPRGDRLIVTAFGKREPKARILQGAVSRCYGERKVSPVAAIEAEGEGAQQFLSFIVSQAAGSHAWQVKQLAADTAAETACSLFELSAAELSDVIIAGDGVSYAEHDQIRCCARFAWARFASRRFLQAALIHGDAFEVAGAVRFRSQSSARHCFISFGSCEQKRLDVSIDGTTQFEMEMDTSIDEIRLNGISFAAERAGGKVRFEKYVSGWRLISTKKAVV